MTRLGCSPTKSAVIVSASLILRIWASTTKRRVIPLSDLVVAFDVGGTNTRARVATVAGDAGPSLSRADVSARVASARELREFVSRIVHDSEREGTLATAVVAVAGPVVGEHSRVTAWQSDSLVDLADLVTAGLPRGRTHLINDMAAGTWGAHARIEAAIPTTRLRLLAAPDQAARPLHSGNVVFVAPGTGLGAAALIRHGLGQLRASVVDIEVQHTQMPRYTGEIGQVIDVLGVALGRAPSWEDLVSGRGLVRTYDALGSIAGEEPVVLGDDAHRAGGIAQAARAGDDEQAAAAIGVFYRNLGHFAQALALTFLPCAGVVIGGASTELNLELLRTAGLAQAFAEHSRFGDLLGRIPIFTVGADANLEGGVWLAAHI